MNYAYVCTNFNNSQLTIDAINSLKICTTSPSKIIVIDNASRREEVEILEGFLKEQSNCQLIKLQENIGYFPGLNVGLRAIADAEFDIVIIGNNDLVFPADFSEKLAENFDKLQQFPVIAPDLITPSGDHQNPHSIHPSSLVREIAFDLYYSAYPIAVAVKTFANATRKFTQRKDTHQHQVAGPIFLGIGACYLLTRKFFENFDEFYAPSFLMYEEYFLTLQLSKIGHQIQYEPAIKIYHCDHGTVGKIASKTIWKFGKDSHKIYRQYVKTYGRNAAIEQLKN